MSLRPSFDPREVSERFFPTTFLYAAGHLWLQVDDLTATVGFTEFMFELVQRQYLYIQLPEVQTTITRGESIGAVDSFKVAMPILAPCSGRVIEVNSDIQRDPQLVMTSPYTRGWLLRLEMSDPLEIRRLMRLADYREYMQKPDALNLG